MRTAQKVAVLQLATRVLNRLSIASLLLSVYALDAVMLERLRWPSVPCAIALAVVAKWLAAGSRVAEGRVIFEARLMSEGRTLQQAQREWLKNYLSRI